MASSSKSSLVEALREVVGVVHVLVEDDTKASYEVDWTRRWAGRSTCVVRPSNTEEVARVVEICARSGTPLVPQGGNTGLVGGSVPVEGEPVVVSLRRLASISDVDRASGQLTVGAGATLAAVQEAVAGSGWEVGVDLASRASATIGGMIATNAGGVRVLRNGMMRRQVVGVEFVRSSGEVVTSMRGLAKDNTGYDLPALMCGSEGTLGIVTRAILQLVPERTHRVAALLPVDDLDEAVRTIQAVRPEIPSLEAAEYVSAKTLGLVRHHTGLPAVSSETDRAILLLEVAAREDPTDELYAAVGEIQGVIAGTDSTSRSRLWRYREAATESIALAGIPQKVDVTLPLDRLADFSAAVETLLNEEAARSELYLFGHIADGGLHVNIIPGSSPPMGPSDDSLDREVMRLTTDFGGSISAEHGIGRAKRQELGFTRTEGELSAMHVIRDAFDPQRLFNPGILI